MNHRRFVRPRAMAGVRGSQFFYLPIRPGAGEARGAGGTSCRRSSPTNRGPLSYRRVRQRPASGAPDGRSYAAPFLLFLLIDIFGNLSQPITDTLRQASSGKGN